MSVTFNLGNVVFTIQNPGAVPVPAARWLEENKKQAEEEKKAGEEKRLAKKAKNKLRHKLQKAKKRKLKAAEGRHPEGKARDSN
ncbi:hypothetical protein LTS13_006655 [Exophiala xenobiotica]|nr:hypothetical protein LTS13_006655 [Exophiala xenobiotica]